MNKASGQTNRAQHMRKVTTGPSFWMFYIPGFISFEVCIMIETADTSGQMFARIHDLT